MPPQCKHIANYTNQYSQYIYAGRQENKKMLLTHACMDRPSPIQGM